MQIERPVAGHPCFDDFARIRSADRSANQLAASTTGQSYRLIRLSLAAAEKPCALQRCRTENGEARCQRTVFTTRKTREHPHRRQTFAH